MTTQQHPGTTQQAAGLATLSEVQAACDAITDKEWASLEKWGRPLVSGTEYSESADLLGDVIFRLLRGQRNWPLGVRFPVAVAMCMKSVASHSRESMRLHRARHCSLDDYEQERIGAGGASPSPEEHLLAAESFREQMMAVDRVKAQFAEDPIGGWVLEGIVRGLSAQEMRRRHALSRAEYKAARQRAMRRIGHIFGQSSTEREALLRQRRHPPATSHDACPGRESRMPPACKCRCCRCAPGG